YRPSGLQRRVLMQKTSFTSAAQKGAAGKAFDYDAAVADIFDMYPQARDKIHFYDLTNNRFVDPDPWEVQKVCVELAEQGAAQKSFKEYAQRFKAEGNSA